MKVLTNNQYYSDIADTIRQMKGVATTYKPREMSGALRDIYSTEVEGVPPLSFPSNGNNLLNYRIDGANGGVGDRTKNLANDNDMLLGYWAYADGTYIRTNTWICTPKIACKGNVGYTFQFANNSRWYGFVWYDENNNFISTANQQNNLQTGFRSFTAKSPSNAGYLVINIAGYPGTNDTIRTDDLINFQLEESSTATDYEPYGYKIPVVISGKNFLQNTATSQTISGVTFTVNSDGSVTCNGTASSNAIFRIVQTPDFPDNEDMLLTGCPVGGSSSTYQLQYSNNRDKGFQDMGNGIVLQKMDYNTYPNTYVQIRIVEGYTCNNLTFYPMIRLATIQNGTYEPYIEPTTTNIYLVEPIEENESKELSDTNVNIPTINGTNILSVNTTVQPSKVYVQAPKTNIGGDYNIKVDTSNNISDNWYGLQAYIVEIGNIDTSNIIDMTNMFSGCQITEFPLLNTQNVTVMTNMFYGCQMITEIPLLNTQNVTNMYGMFYGCSALTTVPLLNTQNVTDMGAMFNDCLALTTVPLLNTQNVTNMGNMFYGCPELTNESLNNVLKMCIDAVNIASSYKTLYYIGLSQAQVTTCTTLSNYQDFLNAGWTTGD